MSMYRRDDRAALKPVVDRLLVARKKAREPDVLVGARRGLQLVREIRRSHDPGDDFKPALERLKGLRDELKVLAELDVRRPQANRLLRAANDLSDVIAAHRKPPTPAMGMTGTTDFLKLGVRSLDSEVGWESVGGGRYFTSLGYPFMSAEEQAQQDRLSRERGYPWRLQFCRCGRNLVDLFRMPSDRFGPHRDFLREPERMAPALDRQLEHGTLPVLVFWDNFDMEHNARSWQENFAVIERFLEWLLPRYPQIRDFLLMLEVDRLDADSVGWMEDGIPPEIYVNQMIGGMSPHEVSFFKSFGPTELRIWMHFMDAWGRNGIAHIPNAHGYLPQANWMSHTMSEAAFRAWCREMIAAAVEWKQRVGIGEFAQFYTALEQDFQRMAPWAADEMRDAGLEPLVA